MNDHADTGRMVSPTAALGLLTIRTRGDEACADAIEALRLEIIERNERIAALEAGRSGEAGISKDELQALAEAAFVQHGCSGWGLSSDALLRCCYQRGADGNGAINGTDDKPGDTVYVHPEHGSELTRHVAGNLWEESSTFRRGYMIGYKAAVPQQPPPVSARLLAAVRAAKRERDATQLPLAPSTMGEIWLALEAIDNAPDQPPPVPAETKGALDRLACVVHEGMVMHAHWREQQAMDVDYFANARAGLAFAWSKGLLPMQPPPVGVTDAMVNRYCDAVAEYLGGLSEEQWAADRKDHIAATQRVARIGLTAALSQQEAAPSVSDLTNCRVPHSKYDACHNCDDPSAQDRECRCDFRTKLVGDGCEVCNPPHAAPEPAASGEGYTPASLAHELELEAAMCELPAARQPTEKALEARRIRLTRMAAEARRLTTTGQGDVEGWHFVLYGRDDEQQPWVVGCADSEALLAAVSMKVFAEPLGNLTNDQQGEVSELHAELLNYGRCDFEGDPSLYLARIAASPEALRPFGQQQEGQG